MRELIRASAVKVVCKYCSNKVLGIALDDLANIVDTPLRSYYRHGEFVRHYSTDADRDYHYEEQEGMSLIYLLEDELEIDYEAAKDLATILVEKDPYNPKDGDEPFYSDDQKYERSELFSGRYFENWKTFSKRIKHCGRFYDCDSQKQLAEILGEAKSPRAAALPILDVGPGTRIELLYRARRAYTEEKVSNILANPSVELGPPPVAKATAGRMNPSGIAVFYGALSDDTAIAEVRPFVGSFVVVGGFKPMRKLRLLDLSRIGIGFTGCIFASDYEDRVAWLDFLGAFHALIGKPILPHDEELEFIPTQAVAEYVSNVLGLDGILYASAQIGAVPEDSEWRSQHVVFRELSDEELKQYNVVLLGAAASVTQKADGDKITSDSGASLDFQNDKCRTVRVTSVKYCYDNHYIYDSDKKNDF